MLTLNRRSSFFIAVFAVIAFIMSYSGTTIYLNKAYGAAHTAKMRQEAAARVIPRSTPHGVVTLKVLHVLDPQAESGCMKSPAGNKLNAKSVEYVAETLVTRQNRIFERSHVNIRIENAGIAFNHAQRDDSKNFGNLVNEYTHHPDSSVVDARRRTNADIVAVMACNHSGTKGIANVVSQPNAHQAIFVFDLTGYFEKVEGYPTIEYDLTYAHELGHTLGLKHDVHTVRDEESGDAEKTDLQGPMHRYVDRQHNVRTIMSYDNACPNKSTCTVLPVYSSKQYAGDYLFTTDGEPAVVIGDDHADATGYMNSRINQYARMNYNAGN